MNQPFKDRGNTHTLFEIVKRSSLMALLTVGLMSCGNAIKSDDTLRIVIDQPTGSQFRLAGKEMSAFKNTKESIESSMGHSDMYSNEFIVDSSKIDVKSLLKKYNGIILSNGDIPPLPNDIGKKSPIENKYKLVYLKSPSYTSDQMLSKIGKFGQKGEVRFSSIEAMNTVGLALDLNTVGEVGLNYVMKPTYVSYSEQKTQNTPLYFQTEDAWWLNDSSTKVTKAWQQRNVSGIGINIAIIDTGFEPNNYDIRGINYCNKDLSTYTKSLNQYDFVQQDYDVSYNSNASAIRHGHGAASVALAARGNCYGSSGVAPRAGAMLFEIGSGVSFYNAGWAVDTARVWGAKVISMSFIAWTWGGWGIPGTYLGEALARSDAAGIINVAGAGNDSVWFAANSDPFHQYVIPAIWPTVIAVGATNKSNTRSSYSNYGPMVDIWAPGGEYLDPDILRVPHNGSSLCYTTFQCAESTSFAQFNGTSAATPFVAGAIALMLQKDPSLNRSRVMSILQSTSNKSTSDATVNGVGLIDVDEAVKAATLP
jgi:serine protease